MNKFSTPMTGNAPRARPFALATPDPTPRSRDGVSIASPTRWADAIGCTNSGTHAASTWPHPRPAQSIPAVAPYTPMSTDHCSSKAGYRGTEEKFQRSYRKSTEGIVPGYCGHVPNARWKFGSTATGNMQYQSKMQPRDLSDWHSQ